MIGSKHQPNQGEAVLDDLLAERQHVVAQPARLAVGGERLRPDARRPRRSLKNLLQEARLPPWLRARLPLLYCGDTLVYVPGIGIDTAFGAQGGELAVEPQWQPDSSQNGA